MSALARLTRRLRALRRDERGALVIEAMLMMPLLMWTFAASWVFFDAYREQSIHVRAAYTISDMLSRETGYITPAYLDSLQQMQTFLIATRQPVRLRVTVFSYDANNDRYEVRWSKTRGGGTALDTDALAGLRGELPVMPHREVGMLVENWVDYMPLFDGTGLEPFTFENRVVSRPRFAGQLCWNSDAAGGIATAIC
ncbi:TadE/TadG family type IV pilus assembly protein [Limimaricola pyoseonensis]|uniref:Flp pilus assembly protein TadG n=1 Tax=Limimaricola pyoseonensis TaxID=521013 RepID=A0A1G7CN44_9RHOB|nr:hypothetical protein [Limimaricola pyoseonensis]SDE40824.1 hypothetical protein SAMN04488567_1573 [Limimaricola pyoseonensis]